MTIPQLLSACTDEVATSKEYEDLFRPLLAIDDFLLFKSIMVERNFQLNDEVEMHLQSTRKKEEERQNEISPIITDEVTTDEDKMLAEVLLKSRLEYDEKIKQEDEDFHRLMRQATEDSLKLYEDELKQRASNERVLQEETFPVVHKLDDSIPSSITSTNDVDSKTSLTDQPGLFVGPERIIPQSSDTNESVTNWLSSARTEYKTQEDEVMVKGPCRQMQSREDYLKEKRDQIVEMKSKTRFEELQQFLEKTPQSAESKDHKDQTMNPMKKKSTCTCSATEISSKKNSKTSKRPVLTPAVANKMKSFK
jgi:hypothetical protein